MESFLVSSSHAAFFPSTSSPHPQAPSLPSSGGAEAAGPGRLPAAAVARAPFPEGPGWRAERSGEVGARGRGAAGPPAAARRRGEREPTSHTFSGENQYRGRRGEGEGGGRRRGGSAALPGSAAAAGAWRRGEAAAAAPGVSLSIAPSSASDSSGRRDSPQRAEKRLLVALSHRGRVSPFWGCPWFRVWCVCAPVCVCVCVCLSVCAAFPSQGCASQTSPPLLASDTPPPPRPPAKIKSRCYLGIGRRRARSSPPPPGPAGPAARRGGRQRPTWQEIKHQ